MRRPRIALSIALGLVGAVWLGQGLGQIGGSVMTGSSFWAFAGVVLLVLAIVLLVRERRRAHRDNR
jgi:hypothetical protein